MGGGGDSDEMEGRNEQIYSFSSQLCMVHDTVEREEEQKNLHAQIQIQSLILGRGLAGAGWM